MNNAAVNIHIQVPVQTYVLLFLGGRLASNCWVTGPSTLCPLSYCHPASAAAVPRPASADVGLQGDVVCGGHTSRHSFCLHGSRLWLPPRRSNTAAGGGRLSPLRGPGR